MVTDTREIELKYEIGPDAVLPPLEDLPRVASEDGPDEQKLEAEYYDTEDLRLLRAGVTLRRRRGGKDSGWHLKLPAGPQTRRELRLPLGRSGRTVPAELVRLVKVYSRGHALAPVARIATVRHVRTLVDEAGTSLAEVVADEVSAQTLGASTTISTWREVEVELTGGDRQLLRAADKRLRRGGLQPAGRTAKLERALADALPAPTGDEHPGGRGSAADVVLDYVAEQADKLKAYDPSVRRDEPDSVHQMRVTTRRLRSTLQSFGKILSTADTKHLAGELRWLSHVLGDARDNEVLSERIEAELHQTPVELVMGPVQARVREHFAPLAGRSRQAVLDTLDSERYFALLDELDQLLADRVSVNRELSRIIDAYAQDAISAFGGGWLAPADWEWIEQNAASSLQLIGMARRRVVALHLCDESVTRAAKLLSMAHGSLSDWLARRSLPGKAGMTDDEQEEDGDS